MFKKAWIIIALLASLCLCACDTVGTDETTGVVQTTPNITAAPETTVPAVMPTAPTETLYPATSVVQAEHILITETVPEYDINASESIVMESDIKNSYFSASYIHLFAPAASARIPFDGSTFWICDDPQQEMKQGNHYKNYIPENDQLKQLQKNYFSKSYTLLGTTVQLELEYSLVEDEVLINYVPAMIESPYAAVDDTSRGIHECLVRFQLPLADGQYACYYAKVDLETGKLTDFLDGFDKVLFSKSTKYQYWCDNDNLIVTDLYDEDSLLYCYNVSDKTLRAYAPEYGQYEVRLHSWKELPDGLLCRFDYYDPDSNQESQKVLESRLWKINRADGSMTPISDGTQFDRLVSYGNGYVLYQDSSKMYYVYNTTSNEYTALPDMKSVFRSLKSTFIYRNEQDAYCIYDAADSESVVLDIPEDFEKKYMHMDSYDGRKITNAYLDENGIYQILIFDADTNTLIELRRSNRAGIGEKSLQWIEDNSKIIVTLVGPSDRQNFIIYDFS